MNPDKRERLRMMAKLFELYPLGSSRDVKGTIAAYLEETSDIPAIAISAALRHLVDQPNRVYLPSVSEIRTTAARLLRNYRRQREGMTPDAVEPDPVSEFRWAREQLPALSSGQRPLELVQENMREQAISGAN